MKWDSLKNWWFLRFRRRAVDEFIAQTQQQYRAAHGIPDDLEGYRQKFRHNLIGKWTTSLGHAGPQVVTRWHFFADGTATVTEFSHSATQQKSLIWRDKTDFVIEVDYLEPEDNPRDGPHWFPLSYDFKLHNGRIVIFETPEKEQLKFQLTPDYLTFEGNHKAENDQ